VDWSDVLKAALSLFLILTGIALAYLFVRMAHVFRNLGTTVNRVTDEVVPILGKGQITMDGINREIDRVDEIMITAVNTAKGAEKTVTTVSKAATAPVRAMSGVAAGLGEAVNTFRSRRRAEAADRATAPWPATSPPPPVTTTPPSAPTAAPEPESIP
jgi:hypothetical protein